MTLFPGTGPVQIKHCFGRAGITGVDHGYFESEAIKLLIHKIKKYNNSLLIV